MKKIILFLLFIMTTLLVNSDEMVKPLKVKNDMYGFKISPNYFYQENQYSNFIKFQNNYFTMLNQIRNKEKHIDELTKYLTDIGNNNIKSICIRDSLLLYIPENLNDDLIKILEQYSKSKKIKNKKDIKEIISIKTNRNLKNISPFTFSTMLEYNELTNGVLLMLPNAEWKAISLDDEVMFYIAGDDYYTGTIHIQKKEIENNYSVVNDKSNYNEYFVKKYHDDNNPDATIYKLKSNEMILIKQNIKIGNEKFKEIFEQITVSPKKYNFQIYAGRKRYYLSELYMYEISITSVIAGVNVLADREYLTKIHGLILDTVRFSD